MKNYDPYFWRFSPKHKDKVTKFLSSTVSLVSGTEPKRIRRLFAAFSCRRWLSTRSRCICSISYDIGDKQKWLDHSNHSSNSWMYICIYISIYISTIYEFYHITLEIKHVNDLPLFIGLLPISSSNQSWFGPVKYKMLLISSGSITCPLVISHVELWKITIF